MLTFGEKIDEAGVRERNASLPWFWEKSLSMRSEALLCVGSKQNISVQLLFPSSYQNHKGNLSQFSITKTCKVFLEVMPITEGNIPKTEAPRSDFHISPQAAFSDSPKLPFMYFCQLLPSMISKSQCNCLELAASSDFRVMFFPVHSVLINLYFSLPNFLL